MHIRPCLTPILSVYWLLFWLLNGLDKFFYRSSLGIFDWHGKDRTEQFTGYFTTLGYPEAPIDLILVATGILEVLVALPFAWCLSKLISTNADLFEIGLGQLQKALALGLVIFLGFITFDVIAGDRAELLEHSTYIAVIAGTIIVGYIELIQMERKSTV